MRTYSVVVDRRSVAFNRDTDRDTDFSVTWNLPPQPWYARLCSCFVSKPPPAPGPRERAHSTMRSVRRASAAAVGSTRPRRIILIRHGESMGNVDHTEYSRTPDWRVELTPKGREQARHAGEALRALNITGELLCVYSSPYMRCQQTLAAVLQGAGIDKGGLAFHRQEPRLREQDFGNFQDPASVARAKEERARFGRFFYRFPNGESGADVYDRVSTWLESLHRELEYGVAMSADSTVLLVTHGLTARLFLMRWYRWSVDTFEATENPGNAAILVMERDALGRYALTPDSLAVVGVGRKPQLGRVRSTSDGLNDPEEEEELSSPEQSLQPGSSKELVRLTGPAGGSPTTGRP